MLDNEIICKADHTASKLVRISNDTFITVDTQCHKIRRCVVRYGTQGFDLHETIIYQDFNATIINVVGELGKMYVMVDDRLEIKIKVLSFNEAMTNVRVQTSIGEDFDLKSDQDFLRAFAQARFIASGCLIIDDYRLTKVSQTSENHQAVFQNYYNFLPFDEIEAEQDRSLLLNQSLISLK